MSGVVSKIDHISPEIAKEFLPYKEDPLNSPIRYFTRTPSKSKQYPASEGWEEITYYTSRTREIKIDPGTVDSQYIYILTNETMPGLVKIGYTKNKPSSRVKEINAATGVAIDFEVKYQFPCFNAHSLEKEIHTYLEQNGFRVNKKKEFFNITLDQAISVVQRMGQRYKMIDCIINNDNT